MVDLNRRRFLTATGASVAALALTGCGGGSGGGPGGDGVGSTLSWWDHFNPLSDLHKETFAAFESDTGTAVEYTLQQAGKMGQALQLAKQSQQLPDVHSNAGLKLPLPALIREGWYQPMRLPREALDRLDPDSIIEGVHTFDGELYSFPIFNFRQYWALTYFNKQVVEAAGLDPEEPPKTYDDFRAATRAVVARGGLDYAYVLGLGQPRRIEEQLGFLAQSGGFEGREGVEFGTGEYRFHHDGYVNAVELLLSMKKDGLLLPGAETWTDKIARARWAAGGGAYYFDGPWCPGVVSQDLGQFLDKLGVGPMLVPDAGKEVTAYRGPQPGAFYLSGSSQQVELASQLLERFTREEYASGLAANMDQPPADLAVIRDADVHPVYEKAVGLFDGACWLAPIAPAQNLDVAKVQAQTKDVKPGLGEVVQGLFSGQLTDVRKELKALSDRSSAERERALTAARAEGAEVELDDWAFPDWTPRKDFTADMYVA